MRYLRYSVSLTVRLAAGFAAAALGTSPLLTGPAAARAAPGDLDLSFRGTGWTHEPGGASTTRVAAMAVQPDKKIVLAGSAFAMGSSIPALAVWRFHPDGSRDTTFNGTGEVLLPQTTNATGNAMVLRSDGRILVSGAWLRRGVSPADPSRLQHLLASFLPDGRPDPAFGPGGQGFVQGTVPGQAGALALQANGRILTGGAGGQPPTVARWLPAGTLDASFGAEGIATLPVTLGVVLASCTALAVQADGKILAARDEPAFSITRLLPNGTVDGDFGGAGTASVYLPDTGFAWCHSLTVMPDGTILGGGNFVDGPPARYGFFAARFLTSGLLDPSFGEPATGHILVPADTHSLTFAGMAVQSDGRILAAGAAGVPGTELGTFDDIALMRLTADGLPDQSFGTAGTVRTDLGGAIDIPRAAALFTDQKLLVAGGYTPQAPVFREEILLARYQAPGSLTLSVEHPPGQESWSLDFGPVTAGTRAIAITLRNSGLTTLTNLQAVLTDASIPGDYRVAPPGATSLSPGTLTTVDVTLEPSAAPGPRTATLRLTADNPGFVPRVMSLTGSKATPTQIWRTTWFGSPDNSGPGADLNDFDHDGLPNIMEYATASHPHQPSSSPLRPVPNTTGPAASFTYTRPLTAIPEFSWRPEIASTPAGPWSSDGLTSNILTTDGTVQTVKVTPAPGENPPARHFLRLRVTRL